MKGLRGLFPRRSFYTSSIVITIDERFVEGYSPEKFYTSSIVITIDVRFEEGYSPKGFYTSSEMRGEPFLRDFVYLAPETLEEAAALSWSTTTRRSSWRAQPM
jgi:hypothetical protein